MKRKLGLLLVVLTLMLSLVSCGSANSLDAIWKDYEHGVSLDLLSNNAFESNNFFGDEINLTGTYSLSESADEQQYIKFQSTEFDTMEFTYKSDGMTLSLFKDGELFKELDKSERREGMIKIPLGYALGFTVNLIGDYAIAIILFTIALKLVLLPISINQTKSQVKMQKVQPIVAKINEKYKHDKQKAQQKTMELYQKAKINPMAGCLPLIINMVILIAFFRVMMYPDTYIYHDGAPISHALLSGQFLWIQNLTNPDLLANIPLFANIIPENLQGMIPGIMPILTALVTLFSFNSMTSGTAQQEQQGAAMMKSMKYFMPLMFLMMGARYPASLMLYWTISSVFQMVQQPIIKKLVDKEVE
ncbi:YidC/Oxa1 family membrane protein insertase [Acidaminobacter sp. JC074]|uniref:YidC/Oxa1 family membrane protein insertase n=1 Tax=Acidaminobacter sp. JC074 TaxID=2530199 RepID=UPI001F10688C|nr:YidC/Oxa1 family membrane protein insertase [Acidaminobacter sp. JC074]MCH4891233.1 YidC/Oxa1 family membrane protein insertase [Acidaminobacter sp. JC074]